jgi:hypothetical protein
LVNQPLWGNVTGIPTSQNPDTPEGLETRLSVRIHRIPSELPHSTEPELGKLRRTRTDSDRASALELLWGLPTSREVLWSQNLTSLSALQEWNCEYYRGLNITFFMVSARGSTMVFIGGVRQCCGWRLGVWGPLVRPGGHASWSDSQVSSLHSLWALGTLSTASVGHVDKTIFVNAPTHSWPAKVMWPTGHSLARLSSCFVPRHFLISYFLWLCLILDIIKICMYFDPYDTFFVIRCSWNGRSTNLVELVIINTYFLYLEWNVDMLMVNICILWPPIVGPNFA